MPAFIYRCPALGIHVHSWSDEEPESADVYKTVACPACSGTHMVNPRTGKVIGADEGSQE